MFLISFYFKVYILEVDIVLVLMRGFIHLWGRWIPE